jgi:hypothetical protein
MDISQIIATEANSVLSGHQIYTTYQPRWEYLFESYIGGEEYRSAGHLHRYQLENAQEYSQRLQDTPLENHCRSVISVYSSFLFRESPTRDLGSLENSPNISNFLRDCDHDGRSLDQFMKESSIWSSVFGHVWIVVAKPDVGSITQADEIESENRPYLNMLTPLVVIDWNWRRLPTGKYKLDYFKYIEDVNGSVKVIKEWRPDTIVTYYVESEKDVILDHMVEPNQLGWIPAVCCYNARSTVSQ